MKIDWKSKLTSRKFWAAVVGFVTPTLLAFGVADEAVTQVTAIIMAGATLIAYIIGEGLVDAGRTDSPYTHGDEEVPETPAKNPCGVTGGEKADEHTDDTGKC